MLNIRNYQLPNGRVPLKDWLMGLADKRSRAAVYRRIDRVILGNFGEHRFLQDSVWELKIDVGPGYRVYYAQEGKVVILLLCAGSKRTQTADIARAVNYWNDYLQRYGKT